MFFEIGCHFATCDATWQPLPNLVLTLAMIANDALKGLHSKLKLQAR